MRLIGGAETESVTGPGVEGEGPSLFRDSEKPENARSTADFIRAAEARDEEMGHPEFLRFAEAFKEGSTGPHFEDIESKLRDLEQDEQKRYSRAPQVY